VKDAQGTQSTPFRLLVVADPQIPDWRSYSDRPWLLNSLTRIVIDNYGRKAWRRIIAKHTPDAIVFLGDLLDAGVHVTDPAELVPPPSSSSLTFPCWLDHAGADTVTL
jgi:metallophosphoesterase superfamily enzyme